MSLELILEKSLVPGSRTTEDFISESWIDKPLSTVRQKQTCLLQMAMERRAGTL